MNQFLQNFSKNPQKFSKNPNISPKNQNLHFPMPCSHVSLRVPPCIRNCNGKSAALNCQEKPFHFPTRFALNCQEKPLIHPFHFPTRFYSWHPLCPFRRGSAPSSSGAPTSTRAATPSSITSSTKTSAGPSNTSYSGIILTRTIEHLRGKRGIQFK